ncbi:MAG TPA: thioredoxin domain-containing protein, partial [Polyangiaceae bacterium]|nr:thioredoxin domain-containing protein [Polyangiaceae bacterium]
SDVDAFRASQALMEVHAQKGNSAFWAFHNRLLEAQGAPDALSQPFLEKLGSELDLSVPKLRSALASSKRAPQAEADVAAAVKAGLTAFPSFTVNGYTLTGTPSASDLRRLIQRALREAGGR